jgi:hypothetical protein
MENKANSDKLIGEFMGHKNVRLDSYEKKAGCYIDALEGWKYQFPMGVYKTLDYLEWNSLMPVVEKIESLGGNIQISTNIISVYSDVVEFINKIGKNI